MEIIILILLLILAIIVSNVFSKIDKSNTLNKILSFSIVFFACGFVTFTNDWVAYEYWIENGIEKDFIFTQFALWLRQNHLSYQVMHIVFVSVYTFLLVNFISKFNKNILIVCLIFLSVNYVFYTTQIRFFLGYFLFLLSFYYYLIERSHKKAILFFLLGFLSHQSILLVIPFYFLFKMNFSKLLKRTIILSLFIGMGYLILLPFLGSMLSSAFDIRFLDYFDESLQSSFLGGLFSFTPFMMTFGYIYILFKQTSLNEEALSDEKYIFLYKLSIIPYIYLVLSFFVQVMGHRFIMSAYLCQILFMHDSIKYLPLASRRKHKCIMFCIILGIVLYLYFLPEYVLNVDLFKKTFIDTFKSNIFLN